MKILFFHNNKNNNKIFNTLTLRSHWLIHELQLMSVLKSY